MTSIKHDKSVRKCERKRKLRLHSTRREVMQESMLHEWDDRCERSTSGQAACPVVTSGEPSNELSVFHGRQASFFITWIQMFMLLNTV